MKRILLVLPFLAAAASEAQIAVTRPSDGVTNVIDYSLHENWLCRPGENTELCTGDLDAVAIGATGDATPVPFHPVAAPTIDCFYVYPTASGDVTFYSGLHREKWVDAAVHEQAARLSNVCRVFAPFYHQLTSAGLRWQVQHKALGAPGRAATIAIMQGIPYRDVLAAWRDYLLHDNHGRGVVLVGHSQGAIILKKLLAEEIDGKPDKKLLVAAYLAGNPDLGTGDFHSLQTCRTRSQTGCLVAWSSYPADYTGDRFFGHATHGEPLCVNPAGPEKERAPLNAFLPRRMGTEAGSTAFLDSTGQLLGGCVADSQGTVLRVYPEPGQQANSIYAALRKDAADGPVIYGFHFSDFILTEGNIIDLINDQSSAYQKQRSRAVLLRVAYPADPHGNSGVELRSRSGLALLDRSWQHMGRHCPAKLGLWLAGGLRCMARRHGDTVPPLSLVQPAQSKPS